MKIQKGDMVETALKKKGIITRIDGVRKEIVFEELDRDGNIKERNRAIHHVSFNKIKGYVKVIYGVH